MKNDMKVDGKYILVDKKPVECKWLLKWAKWIEKNRDKTRVKLTEINSDIRVSTVFLGINHNWWGGPPILFETMVFGGKADGDIFRYETWEEAEKGHKKVVVRVRKLEKEK